MLIASARARIAWLNLVLCAAPYVGLRANLTLGMHSSLVTATVPPPWVLGILFALGVVIPTVGVVWTLRWALRDGLHFELASLLGVYGTLIVLFASSYAIVQASGTGTSFSGMPAMWSVHDPATLEVHTRLLHVIFLESLYLSVMTITTVGYGDIAPLTPVGKALAAFQGLAGIGFVGIALGHYFSVCLRRRS